MRAILEPPERSSRHRRTGAVPWAVKAMLAVIVVLAFAVLAVLWSQNDGPFGPGASAMSGAAPKPDSDSSRTLSE